MQNRMLLPDIAKSLCVLYIVAFWHILDYVEPVAWKENFASITNGVLATFTFFSGLFLGKKECSFIDFYKDRIRRFVPLLLVAVISFYFINFIGIKNGLFILCGLSSFVPPYPPTLWYFGMMIVFYIVTPFLLYKLNIATSRDKKILIIKGLILELAFLTLHMYFPTDIRLVLFFPYYLLGMVCPIDIFSKQKALAKLFMVCIVLAFVGGQIDTFNIIKTYSIFGLILFVCKIIEPIVIKFNSSKVFILLSYSSMSAYLFHRPIYKLLVKVYDAEFVNIFQIVGMISILFIGSYFIQKAYDSFLKK